MEPLIVFFTTDSAKNGSETNNGAGNKRAAPQDSPSSQVCSALSETIFALCYVIQLMTVKIPLGLFDQVAYCVASDITEFAVS